jgi:GT2 family glycosyltransferase
MYVSKHYDRPLLEEVEKSPVPLVACAWRFEPNIWHQADRIGTTMVPDNTDEGFGVYHYDFQPENFEAAADEFVTQPEFRYRKVEGVSYVMRKADWDKIGGNDPRYAPASWEDRDLEVRMDYFGYNFLVTSKAVVWHFGSRGAIFMNQPNKLIGRSARQIEAEKNNQAKWLEKWGEPATFEGHGPIILTDSLRKKCKELYG